MGGYKPTISYTTKKEGKAAAEKAFLELSPSERVRAFIRLCEKMAGFESQDTQRHKGNFILKKKSQE